MLKSAPAVSGTVSPDAPRARASKPITLRWRADTIGWKCAMTPFDSMSSPIDGLTTVTPIDMGRTSGRAGVRDSYRESRIEGRSMTPVLQAVSDDEVPQNSAISRGAVSPAALRQVRRITLPFLHAVAPANTLGRT